MTDASRDTDGQEAVDHFQPAAAGRHNPCCTGRNRLHGRSIPRLRYLAIIACAVILQSYARAENEEELPPLTGHASGSDGSLKWESTAFRAKRTPNWTIKHDIENVGTGTLRTKWDPDVYEGWVPAGKNCGSSVTCGPVKPASQQGMIEFGKNGSKAAPSYKSTTPKDGRLVTTADIVIYLQINDRVVDVRVQAISVVSERVAQNVPIAYTLKLKDTELSKELRLDRELRLEWAAVKSKELDAEVKTAGGETSMKFAKEGESAGVAHYQIFTTSEPTLRHGLLVFKDSLGNRLGAAYAPAYAPESERRR